MVLGRCPTAAWIDDARGFWEAYDWSRAGEEWSWFFGGTARLYQEVVLPRIRPYVPAKTILEIATGYGRITEWLLDELAPGGALIGVDLVERCVSACQERFAGRPATFHVCDGLSLPMISDGSIDFAISWDSLVHAGPDILRAYLGELARVLTVDGAALLHHSNLAALRVSPTEVHGRHPEMSARRFRALAVKAKLACTQELLTWGDSPHLDCLSIVRRR